MATTGCPVGSLIGVDTVAVNTGNRCSGANVTVRNAAPISLFGTGTASGGCLFLVPAKRGKLTTSKSIGVAFTCSVIARSGTLSTNCSVASTRGAIRLGGNTLTRNGTCLCAFAFKISGIIFDTRISP